jgi:hypothetical protein
MTNRVLTYTPLAGHAAVSYSRLTVGRIFYKKDLGESASRTLFMLTRKKNLPSSCNRGGEQLRNLAISAMVVHFVPYETLVRPRITVYYTAPQTAISVTEREFLSERPKSHRLFTGPQCVIIH